MHLKVALRWSGEAELEGEGGQLQLLGVGVALEGRTRRPLRSFNRFVLLPVQTGLSWRDRKSCQRELIL